MIYFLADAHLGSLATEHRRTQERRLCRFLDDIAPTAEAIYMLGDMFDYWYEYHTAVPKGYTRFLGRLSALTDRGVDVHYFTGNHDIWAYRYLADECGVTLHFQPETVELHGRTFYLAHGDGIGRRSPAFRAIQAVFHSPTLQRLYTLLHPDLTIPLGLRWAKHSRLKRDDGREPPFKGEEHEPLVQYAKQYLATHPDIDTFVFGHRHIAHHQPLPPHSELVMLGDWLWQYTYAAFDGEHIYLEHYTEGLH